VAPTASVAVRTLNMVLLVVAETRMLGEMGKRKVWGCGVSNACGQDVLDPVLKTIKLTNMHELIPIARNLRLAPTSLPASLHHAVRKPDPPNIRLPIIERGNGPLRASDLLGDRLVILPVLLRPGHVPMVLRREDLVLMHIAAAAGVACEGGRDGGEGGRGGCE